MVGSEIFIVIGMFAVLFLFIMLNIPVAFSLFLTAIIFAISFWGWGGLNVVYQGLWNAMGNWPLVALPLFIFMSAILEKAGVAEELFGAFYKWLGHIRGSLGVIGILLGYTIGAMSGVVGAAMSALALLLYPYMRRQGYPKKLTLGTILGGGCLPQIVPPSFNMIVYGTVAGVSVGKLFVGGIGAGTVIAVLSIIYILIWSHLHKEEVPLIETKIPLREKIAALKYMIGPIILIVGVLGSIFLGVATPTEAGGVGAFLALVYAIVRKRMTWQLLKEALVVTLNLTVMVSWLIAGGTAFSNIFSAIGGKRLLIDVLTSLPEARITVLALSIAILVVLGMFVDQVSIIMIMAPTLSPAIVALGYDPVWWGVVFCTLLIVAIISPPVGAGLYYVKAALGREVEIDEIYSAAIPYVIIQIIATVIIILKPELVLWFVDLLFAK